MPPVTTLRFHRSPTSVRIITAQDRAAAAQKQQEAAANAQMAERLDYLQGLLNDVGVAIEDLQQQHRNSLAEMQQATVELAVAAASWIVGAAIDANMFAVDDLVRAMIDKLQKEQPVRIFLHAEDVQLLNGLKSSSDAPNFADADVEFVADSELARGVVRAESTRTTLITDLDDRLADIRRIWMENLNETQTERRADDPAGREFRRFPERRHTA